MYNVTLKTPFISDKCWYLTEQYLKSEFTYNGSWMIVNKIDFVYAQQSIKKRGNYETHIEEVTFKDLPKKLWLPGKLVSYKQFDNLNIIILIFYNYLALWSYVTTTLLYVYAMAWICLILGGGGVSRYAPVGYI